MIDTDTNPVTSDNQAEPTNPTEPNATAESSTPADAENKGGWANLSADKKRNIKIGVIALVLVIVMVFRFASHKSAAAASTQNGTSQADIANAEHTAATSPTAPNFLQLSFVYYLAKRYNDCIKAAQKAIALKPDYSTPYNNIAAADNNMGKWDSAIVAANKAVSLEPNSELFKGNLVAATKGKKAQDDKIASLEKTAAEKPTPENFFVLSGEYYRAYQYDKCIAAARKAIALKPDYGAAYNNICAAYNNLGNFEEAKKAGDEAVRIDPNSGLFKANLKFAMDNMSQTGVGK